MFKGFKFQVVLPVAAIAMLLITGGAVGFSVWATQHEERLVQQQIDDKVASLQGILVTTAELMVDRTHASMSLLVDQVNTRGGAERGRNHESNKDAARQGRLPRRAWRVFRYGPGHHDLLIPNHASASFL